jgi:hypothetical protein
MYSIVQACQQWKHYIMGKEMIIHTDHKPLQFMQTQGKLQNDHHQKWSTYLQQFHLNIKYKKGNTNHVVDYLSQPLVVVLTTVLNSCGHETSGGPNCMTMTLTSLLHIRHWAQVNKFQTFTSRMHFCAIWAIFVFLQVSMQS